MSDPTGIDAIEETCLDVLELALREGRFGAADGLLRAHVPGPSTVVESLTLLTLAWWGKEHLSAWSDFWDRVEANMQRELGHERAARLLANRSRS